MWYFRCFFVVKKICSSNEKLDEVIGEGSYGSVQKCMYKASDFSPCGPTGGGGLLEVSGNSVILFFLGGHFGRIQKLVTKRAAKCRFYLFLIC